MVGLPLKEFYRKVYTDREKASPAAKRKGGGMNAALLKNLPMKLDSVILKRALRKRGTGGEYFKATKSGPGFYKMEPLPEEERVILLSSAQALPAGTGGHILAAKPLRDPGRFWRRCVEQLPCPGFPETATCTGGPQPPAKRATPKSASMCWQALWFRGEQSPRPGKR